MKYEESASQIQLVRWFKMQYPQYADLLVSYPAGLNLTVSQRVRAKSMGLKAGVPDLILFVPMLKDEVFHPCLFIEMKTESGRLSEVQRHFHCQLRKLGYTIVVCHSASEGMDEIKKYLDERG